MAKWSVSQQKFIDETTPVAGGIPSEQPAGMTPGIGGNLTGGSEQIFNALMMLGLTKAGTTTGGRVLQAAQYFKPPKTPEAEKKRKLEKSRAATMAKQMDAILNKWGKIPLVERLPIPGIGRVSPTRASFETARDAYNYFIITLLADKRITDAERKYFQQLFPSLLSTKEVAKVKVNEMKDFINNYAGMESPATMETPAGTKSIVDFADQYEE